ncbi:ABC transporter substrate-binding protein [Frankia sp. AiPs1]|uniref:ABC transporter substrate-binding protein n=1 Tax=Frankia sp. AiPs1 TaxID=573493 RepID=UPI002042BED7|nr:ABC transporter substrate-binding protein [Frankia sp. AiPs1]MCM3921894.1 ABC transporter substrate-binding protein [Frankia sp. AiPs1]
MSGTTKIGMLCDWPLAPEAEQLLHDVLDLTFDEALQDGLIDRPIEVIYKLVHGLPTGDAHTVIQAGRELVDAGVVAIDGPWISDNAIPFREWNDREGHVPSVAMCGTDLWYGEWCFNINNGSLAEDPYVMSNYLAVKGIKTVAVVYDKTAIGDEYRGFFRDACDFDGVEVLLEHGVDPLETEMGPAVERLRSAGADALAYLGVGVASVHINRALAAAQWDPFRVMCTAFMSAPVLPQGMAALKGWVGCDQYDETNTVARDFLDRFERRYDYRPENWFAIINYDIAQMIAHGISKARPLSPAGVKAGLERVKMLPAATGGARGLLSFAPYVHRAWLSPDFLVMREVRPDLDEKVGLRDRTGTVMRHRFQPRSRTDRLPAANGNPAAAG